MEKTILNLVHLWAANIKSNVIRIALGTCLSGVDIVKILGVDGDVANLSTGEVLRVDVIVSIDSGILVNQIVLRSILISNVISIGRSSSITCTLPVTPVCGVVGIILVIKSIFITHSVSVVILIGIIDREAEGLILTVDSLNSLDTTVVQSGFQNETCQSVVNHHIQSAEVGAYIVHLLNSTVDGSLHALELALNLADAVAVSINLIKALLELHD